MVNHIMIVINKMDFGGAQRVVANLANYLCRNGKRVEIISISSETSVYELEDGVEHITIKKHENGKNKFTRATGGISELRHIVKSRNPDVVISFLTDINILVIPALFKLKTPLIVSERNDPKRNPTNKLKRIARRLLYRFSEGFIFQTEDAKSFFSKQIQDRGAVLPNPLIMDYIPQRTDSNRKKEFVTIGRLEPQKNHKLLIDSFSTVVKAYPEYHLTIYGEGGLRKELLNYVFELGLEYNISLPGVVSNVTSKIIDSYAFVLSSDFEGMPNALMEAMACGLPVISTNCPCGGPAFLIENEKNGLLVPVGSEVSLTNSMLRLIEDVNYANQIGGEAQNINYTLSPDRVFKDWLVYIEKLV